MAKRHREKLEVKETLKTERIPLLFVYIEDGEIKSEFTALDYKAKSPYEVYGYLRLLVRNLEEKLLYGEED